MYHISDVKKFKKCKRLFQHSFNESGTSFNFFVKKDADLTDLVCKKLKIDKYFKGEAGDDKLLALNALKNEEWLVKARFEYQDLRVKVPFLHKTGDTWDVYFLFVGNFPHEDSLFYSSIIWVLENNGVIINNLFVIHLNNEYIRGDELNEDELFIVSDSFYNQSNHKSGLLNDILLDTKIDFTNILAEMNIYKDMNLVNPVLSKACNKITECSYYSDCFKEYYEDNSILTLVGSQHKRDMYNEGISFLKDVDLNRLEGNRKQFAQIMADKNGGLFFDKLALDSWKKNLKLPLIFLDFEWETYAVPPYKGMKPYDVLPFEYSIHIYDGKKLIHKDYVGFKDTRKEMAEKLLADIPKKGSIVAFNALAAEKIRIKELADYMESKELLNMTKRIVDLQFPFEAGLIYDTRMRGSYSLKTIMSLLDDKSYKELDISQGMDAVFSYRKIELLDNQEDIDEIVDSLKAYCGMDTYAMYAVYKWLESLW